MQDDRFRRSPIDESRKPIKTVSAKPGRAHTDRACTSSPTQLPSLITGASRNCGSTAGPLPTATRANLRARRRALHTVWRSRAACNPKGQV